MSRVWGIVPAAGAGERMGARRPKAFALVGAKPMVSLAAKAVAPFVQGLVVSVPSGWEVRAVSLVGSVGVPLEIATGGDTRQESVRLALACIPGDADVVVVHDAARPLAAAECVARVIEALDAAAGAVCAVPVSDTLKRASAGLVSATVPRDGLWAAQTPQAFRAGILRRAHAQAVADGVEATDDAALVERLGEEVAIVAGAIQGFKVTTQADLALANMLVASVVP